MKIDLYVFSKVDQFDNGLTQFDPTPNGRDDQSYDGCLHDIPIADPKKHVAAASCWCEPVFMGFCQKSFNMKYLHRFLQ